MKAEERQLLWEILEQAEEVVLWVGRRTEGEAELKELRRFVEKLNNSLCVLDRMIQEEDAGSD